MSHILIVEDSLRVSSFLEKGLKTHGYTTSTVDNGNDAISIMLDDEIDLMILDLELPQTSGLTVLERLREQRRNIAVIILSASHEMDDKLASFSSGADDYLTKPFRFEELLVRIRARLRDVRQLQAKGVNSQVLNLNDLEINLRSRQVHINGRLINLSAREFILVETFMRHPGQILSREQLLDKVWGYDYNPGTNIVDVYIGYLRKKLGRCRIETIRGMGYRLKYE
ncbi:MAG: response regulator transcription factor [Cyanobacteria bacterium P01_H01_bin.21]